MADPCRESASHEFMEIGGEPRVLLADPGEGVGAEVKQSATGVGDHSRRHRFTPVKADLPQECSLEECAKPDGYAIGSLQLDCGPARHDQVEARSGVALMHELGTFGDGLRFQVRAQTLDETIRHRSPIARHTPCLLDQAFLAPGNAIVEVGLEAGDMRESVDQIAELRSVLTAQACQEDSEVVLLSHEDEPLEDDES